ncbi:Uncharacterised protein [Shimwellia blattae]|nr:Uncharacterised protein [Shimwellia blattae]VEC21099.1 Uncharacterised protein [Shimwellia blattae]
MLSVLGDQTRSTEITVTPGADHIRQHRAFISL